MIQINRYILKAAATVSVLVFCTPSHSQDVSELSTAAISGVTGEQMYATPTSNITNTLYGLLPGLSVMSGSGQLGYDIAEMTIRGKGTFNSEDSYTVYVDGFETDPSFITYMLPSEIAHVYVLKDAAALSMLGMKGANGAIYIETKRGHDGKMKVTFNARTGIQQPKLITKPLGANEYASYYNEAYSNDAYASNHTLTWDPIYTSPQTVDTDWYEETLRDHSTFASTDISVSGGNENLRYFTTLGYVRSNGFYDVKNTDQHKNANLNQYVIRTNFDFNAFGIFEGKVDVGGRMTDNASPNFDQDYLWWNLETYPNNIYTPYTDVKDKEHLSGTQIYPNNPVGSILGLGYQTLRERTYMANVALKEKLDFITPGLYLYETASFANWTKGTYILSRNYTRWYDGVAQTSDYNTDYTITDDNGTNAWFWNQFKARAGYDRSFGKHTVSAFVGYEQYVRNVDADMNGNAGVQTRYAHQAINGRANWSYDRRYVAEFGFSWCGSDNYRKGNRFHFYPTVSAAWIASNEAFLKDSEAVDLLKVRFSAGTTGYDYYSGGRYLYYQYFTGGNSFPTGNSTDATWNSSLVPAFFPDPDITSETSFKLNLGVDVKLFNSLQLSVDVYRDKRTGIVTQDNSYPAGFGVGSPYRNVGEVTSGGVDLSINYARSFGEFSFAVGGIMSYMTNKINYMAEIAPASPLAAQTGNRIGSIFGYESDGFYDVSDFDADGNLISSLPTPLLGSVQPGDIKYKDLNNDNFIDERDKTLISKGGYNPELYYGITLQFAYKGFDLSMLFQGVGGRDVNLLDAGSKTKAFCEYSTIYPIAEGRWAYYPEQGIDTRAHATYPRLTTGDNTNNYVNSDFWIKDGDYFTLRNIELGYNLPAKVCNAIRLESARIYVSGINVFSISEMQRSYKMDPDNMTGYPAVKSWNIGLSIGF